MKPFEGDTHIPQEILKLKERFNIKSVLETGSQYGFTLKWFTENFEDVTGCELVIDFFMHCVKSNLFCVHGKSTYVIQQIDAKDLYYLDAHGFGTKCPLKNELKEIAKKGHQPVICIHDFKTGNPELGYDVYEYELCYEEIKPYLEEIYKNGYDYHYNTVANGAKRGIIYIYPKTQ